MEIGVLFLGYLLKFNPIDSFSYYCVLDGQRIGKVDYSPSSFYSWIFTNTQGNIQTFGSTKFQAVKLYVSNFLDPAPSQ